MQRAALCLLVAATGTAGAVACTGGSGPLPNSQEGWDSDRGERNVREAPRTSTTDPAGATREAPPPSQDTAPGAGGGFLCDGIYDCSLTSEGRTVTVKVPLQMRNGVCVAGGEVILEPNGIARGTEEDSEGQTGTWVASGNGLVLSANDQVITCVRSTEGATTEEGAPGEVQGQGQGEAPSVEAVPPRFDGGS